MDQSTKDTRDTSDHKYILIRNPAYKYKHYKVLKSEGLVGAVPVQRLPRKLHDCLPLSLQFIHYKFPANFYQPILSEPDDLFLIAVVNLPEFPCHFLQFSACEMSGLKLASHSPLAVYIQTEVKYETKKSTEFRPQYKLKHLIFVIYLITC